jgi:hypothetical protein
VEDLDLLARGRVFQGQSGAIVEENGEKDEGKPQGWTPTLPESYAA